jgi:drug/metabolite transporter (DMT)-like permease
MVVDEPAPRSQRTLGLLAVVASIMCFGVSFGIIKWPGVPGSVIAWWRLVGSAILWWTLLLTLRRFRGRPLPSRHDWTSTLPAALCFGVYISVFFTAVTKTSVAHAEFINGLAPLLVIPAGFLFFHERPNWGALRWGLLSVTGLMIVLFTGPEQGAATLEGDLLMIIVLSMTVSYYMASKRARGRGVATPDFMAIVMPVALITATPVAVSIAGDELWPLSWQSWVAVGLLSVLTGGAGHGLLFYAHRSVPIATISVMQVGQPALSAFWAWVIVGETITATQVPGMALVIVGMALVVWFSQRSAEPQPQAEHIGLTTDGGREPDQIGSTRPDT